MTLSLYSLIAILPFLISKALSECNTDTKHYYNRCNGVYCEHNYNCVLYCGDDNKCTDEKTEQKVPKELIIGLSVAGGVVILILCCLVFRRCRKSEKELDEFVEQVFSERA